MSTTAPDLVPPVETWTKEDDYGQWKQDSRGRWYHKTPRGIMFRRHDEETVAEGLVRDAAAAAERAANGPQKKRRDPRPKVKKPEGLRVPTGVGDAELTGMLAQLLSMPAIPAQMVLGCSYCAQHFATQGPATAVELVKLSKDHPDLRKMLERWYAAFDSFTWGSVLVTYAAKPLLHHLAPAPVLAGVGPLMGIPPREPSQPVPHTHRAETDEFMKMADEAYVKTNPVPPMPSMPEDPLPSGTFGRRRTPPFQPRRREAANRAPTTETPDPDPSSYGAAELAAEPERPVVTDPAGGTIDPEAPAA